MQPLFVDVVVEKFLVRAAACRYVLMSCESNNNALKFEGYGVSSPGNTTEPRKISIRRRKGLQAVWRTSNRIY